MIVVPICNRVTNRCSLFFAVFYEFYVNEKKATFTRVQFYGHWKNWLADGHVDGLERSKQQLARLERRVVAVAVAAVAAPRPAKINVSRANRTASPRAL